MHELSLAEELIRLAESEVLRNNAHSVSEITIEVGTLCGVEADSFESALMILSEGSCVENSGIKIIRKKGRGICKDCGIEYEMEHRIDECPLCHRLPSAIKDGREFRVVSIVIETE